MKLLKYILVNTLSFAALIYGGLAEGTLATISANFFVGITILCLASSVVGGIIVFSPASTSVFQEMAASGNIPTRSVPANVDWGLDVAMALICFAMGFWVCGAIWTLLVLFGPAVMNQMYDPENYKLKSIPDTDSPEDALQQMAEELGLDTNRLAP